MPNSKNFSSNWKILYGYATDAHATTFLENMSCMASYVYWVPDNKDCDTWESVMK
jgi:hypothetical protein